MDATAVALTRGLLGARREIFIVPVLFGGFQAGMAGIGLALGTAGQGFLGSAKLWIAAGLLLMLGIRMAMAGLPTKADPTDHTAPAAPAVSVSLVTLISLSFATSIDAAAAGATLPTLPVTPAISLGLIGLVTLACSAAAIVAGRKLRQRTGGGNGHLFEVAGGLVLVGLAIKTAYDAATL